MMMLNKPLPPTLRLEVGDFSVNMLKHRLIIYSVCESRKGESNNEPKIFSFRFLENTPSSES
jgi:hypothetical protein